MKFKINKEIKVETFLIIIHAKMLTKTCVYPTRTKIILIEQLYYSLTKLNI